MYLFMSVLYGEDAFLEDSLWILDSTGQLLEQHMDIEHLNIIAMGNDDVACVLFLLVLLWDEGRPDEPMVQAVWGEHVLLVTRYGCFECYTDSQRSVKGR